MDRRIPSSSYGSFETLYRKASITVFFTPVSFMFLQKSLSEADTSDSHTTSQWNLFSNQRVLVLRNNWISLSIYL